MPEEINNITQRERLQDMTTEEMKAELARYYRSAGRGPGLTQSNIDWMQTLERAIENRRLASTTTPGYRIKELLNERKRLELVPMRERDFQRIGAINIELEKLTRENQKALGSAALATSRRVTRFGGKSYKVMDAGAANTAKVNQVREMLGLPSWEAAGFMTPVIDPETQQQIGTEISQAYRSSGTGTGDEFRFGPTGRMAQRAGSFVGGRNLDMLTGMSVSEMKDFYLSLTPDELRKVQTQLMQAGFYGEGKPPTWGTRDQATEQAFVSMMITWADRPDVNLRQLLDELKRSYSAQLDPEVRKLLGTDVASQLGDQFENITVTDATTLGDIVDTLSTDLLGTGLDPGVRARLIAKLQEQEKAYKMNDATNRFNQAVATQKSVSGGASSELDAFMGALIGQESGGDPNAVNERTGAAGLGQMMNWSGWAREAGVDPSDFSAANQKRVIRYKLAQYYQMFGNWRDVAIAWYGGEGAPAEIASGNWSATRPQGYGNEPSFNDYADSVLAKMNANLQGSLASGAVDPTLNFNVSEDLPDARTRVEAELKTLDPARYYGTRFYKGAEVYFNMLRSPF